MGARWLNAETWVCDRHAPAAKHPAAAETCWYCGVARPAGMVLKAAGPPRLNKNRDSFGDVVTLDLEYRKHVDGRAEFPAPTACAWKDCDKPAAGRSKYCSRECSNKNARWRHRQRRRAG